MLHIIFVYVAEIFSDRLITLNTFKRGRRKLLSNACVLMQFMLSRIKSNFFNLIKVRVSLS